MRASRLVSGASDIIRSLKASEGDLLIVAEDANEKDKKYYQKLASHAGIPFCMFGEKNKLGIALGKGVRAAVLITDRGFAKAILNKIKN